MAQESGVDKIQLWRFDNAFPQIVCVRLQEMDNKGRFQDRQPTFHGWGGHSDVFGDAVHGKKLTAARRADLDKFPEGREIAGIDLALDIKVQICIDVTFIPVG